MWCDGDNRALAPRGARITYAPSQGPTARGMEVATFYRTLARSRSGTNVFERTLRVCHRGQSMKTALAGKVALVAGATRGAGDRRAVGRGRGDRLCHRP